MWLSTDVTAVCRAAVCRAGTDECVSSVSRRPSCVSALLLVEVPELCVLYGTVSVLTQCQTQLYYTVCSPIFDTVWYE